MFLIAFDMHAARLSICSVRSAERGGRARADSALNGAHRKLVALGADKNHDFRVCGLHTPARRCLPRTARGAQATGCSLAHQSHELWTSGAASWRSDSVEQRYLIASASRTSRAVQECGSLCAICITRDATRPTPPPTRAIRDGQQRS